MFIKIEFSENGELCCQEGCPCLDSGEYGYDCNMGYLLGNLEGDFNGWVNRDTGEVLRTKKKRRGRVPYGVSPLDNYIHPGDGWYKAIVRPQECIDAHGL